MCLLNSSYCRFRANRLTEVEIALLLQFFEEDESSCLCINFDSTERKTVPIDNTSILVDLRVNTILWAVTERSLENVSRSIANSLRGFAAILELNNCTSSTPIPCWLARAALSHSGLTTPLFFLHTIISLLPSDKSGYVTIKDFITYSVTLIMFYHNSGNRFAECLSNSCFKHQDIPVSDIRSILDSTQKTLINYLHRTVVSEFGRGCIEIQTATRIFLSAPIKDDFTGSDLKSLVSALEFTDDLCTKIPPIDHVRKWLQFVFEVRQSELYKYFNSADLQMLANNTCEKLDFDSLGIKNEQQNTDISNPLSRKTLFKTRSRRTTTENNDHDELRLLKIATTRRVT